MNKQQGSAHVIVVGALVVALLGALGFIFWQNFANNKDAPQAVEAAKQTAKNNKVTFTKTLAYTDGLSVKAYIPADNKTVDVYEASEAEKERFCGHTGCETRHVAVSPDNALIAIDKLVQNGEPAVGLYDQTTKKTETLTTGGSPHWSADGKYIAVSDKSGIKIINAADRSVKILKNTAAYTDGDVGSYNAVLYGWSGNTVVYDAFNTIDDASLMVGDVDSLASKKVTIGGLTDEQSIRHVQVSQSGKLLLLGFDNDPGYNVGTASTGGADFKVVTNNLRSPWPGSGYYIGGMSPDTSKIVVINNFIAAGASGSRATGLFQVHDSNGKHLFTVSDYRALEDTGLCWDGNDAFYGLYYAGNTDYDSTMQLAKYTISKDKLEFVGTKIANGYGTSISCGN